MAYPFRQGIDYGPRRGTLGLAFHMSEGGDGLVSYLSKGDHETDAQWRTRIRGVSANACILSDGTIWQMVNWGHASGSMNPNNRGPVSGYYNAGIIKDVLGAHYVDPNAYSISVEIAGFRAKGPTDAQVRSAVQWGHEMRQLYPTIRGAYGHADQTNTKGCPGLSANMKKIFEGVGGHGQFTANPIGANMYGINLATPNSFMKIGAGKKLYDNSEFVVNANTITVNPAREMPFIGSGSGARVVQYTDEHGVLQPIGRFLRVGDSGPVRVADVAPGDPTEIARLKAELVASKKETAAADALLVDWKAYREAHAKVGL